MTYKDLMFNLEGKGKLGVLKVNGCAAPSEKFVAEAQFDCGRTSTSGSVELSLAELKQALQEVLTKLPT